MRFATQIYRFNRGLDDGWVREVSDNATVTVVRVMSPYLARLRGNGKETISWEAAVRRMLSGGKGGRPADLRPAFFAVRYSSTYDNGLTKQSLAADHTWGDRVVPHLRQLLDEVRFRTGRPIIVHADDYAARWVLLSQVDSTRIVMDNPVVMRSEIGVLHPWVRIPAIVRRGWWAARDRDRIRLPSIDDLITSRLQKVGAHGRWSGNRFEYKWQPLGAIIAGQARSIRFKAEDDPEQPNHRWGARRRPSP